MQPPSEYYISGSVILYMFYMTVVSELSQVAGVVVEKQKIMGGDGFMVVYIIHNTYHYQCKFR